ncbi:hypothetical protein ACWEF6_01985 [Amycolatopsis sp. NPDC004772]
MFGRKKRRNIAIQTHVMVEQARAQGLPVSGYRPGSLGDRLYQRKLRKQQQGK